MNEPCATMDFTSEEMLWLENISSEVCENSELSPMEKVLSDMARPKNDLEGMLFELTAYIRFGLTEPPIYPQFDPQLSSSSTPSLSLCGWEWHELETNLE
ncbi:hypothetical protein ANANG_G00196070 [Anguilla anguilla]|uniref:Uncharacterized protein n=1 Tax=Anguilla anguilla TaxID=7936 RepID=A0A9D3M5D2_ANGAN|nr:hypothetical protein ANANG_G00196070 [Anguilla anguilla]